MTAAISRVAEAASASRASSVLQVSRASDSFEVEADRVADAVVGGGHVPGWSFSSTGAGIVRRQVDAGASDHAASSVVAPGHRGAASRPGTAALKPLRLSGAACHPKPHGAKGRDDALHQAGIGAQAGAARPVTTHSATGSTAASAGSTKAPAAPSHAPRPARERRRSPHARPSELWSGTVIGAYLREREVSAEARSPTREAAPETATGMAGTTGTAHAPAATPAPVTGHGMPRPHSTTPGLMLRKIDPGHTTSAAHPEVDHALQSPGRPLDAETRAFMESRLGFDLSPVRVHTDGRAAESARALGAKAYTVGADVVFAEGRYAPHASEGRHLLAHELAHVVQQSGAPTADHAGAGRAARGVQRAFDTGPFSAIVGEVVAKLQKLPGYTLMTLILGKDPLTGKQTPSDATTLVGAVLELMPGGKDAFEKLKQNNAIEQAVAWIRGKIADLHFTEAHFEELLQQVAAGASAWHPFKTIDLIKEILRPHLEKLMSFAGDVLRKVAEFVVDSALDAIGGQEVKKTLHNAGASLSLIASDPVAFLRHLVDALKLGFNQFSGNIVNHLQEGLVEWLFGAVKVPGLAIPKQFDLASIGGMVLSILGITWARFRESLVGALGEQAIAFLEKSLDVVKALAGPGGLRAAWKLIVDSASDLLDTMLGKVRDWVMSQVVKIAVPKIVALFNPVAGLIESIRAIYETIKFFIEKAKQLSALIQTIVDSLSEIAHGNIEKAANWIEQTMTRTIPLLLGFLAGFLHLDGIGAAIRGVIEGVRAKVKAAFDKVVGMLVSKGRAAWDATKGVASSAVASVSEWWKEHKPFKLGDEKHEMFLEGSEDHPEVMVQSAKSTLQKFLEEHVVATPTQKKELIELAKEIHWHKKEESKDDKPEPSKKGKAADSPDKFDLLLTRIAALPSMGGKGIPDSKIVSSEVHEFGAGKKTDAFLTLKHPVGTEPDKSNDPPIWTDLGDDLVKARRYVRGHMLSQRLGGQGVWKNMMPITNKANQQMYNGTETGVEQKIIEVISTGKAAVHFVIKASYADSPKKPGNPVTAESRLKTLSWTVTPAEWSGGWKNGKGDLKTPKGEVIDPRGSVEATA